MALRGLSLGRRDALEAARTSKVTYRVVEYMSELTMINFVIVYGSHMLPRRTVFAINDARAPDPP